MTTPPRLAVDGLQVRRGTRAVLSGLSLAVGAGEIVGLLGPNGAGKSTAFQVLTGLLRPDAGTLRLDGVEIPFGARELRARMGVVFQEPALDPRLTARENLLLAARLYAVPAAAARERAASLLAGADLAGREDEPVGRFSGGMKRRLEIARSLVHRPALLLLDEPTTGLDEAAFRRTWARLAELRRTEGLTMLLTTHRADEAEQCDRLAILDGGRLVADGTPDELRGRVAGDLVILEPTDPDAAAARITELLGAAPRRVDRRLVVERKDGHELVPRLVEALPPGTLRSVTVRRTGLGEVFLELTGHDLDGERESGGDA